MVFIPGYLATVTLNSVNITAIGNVLSLSFNKATMTKPVFGNDFSAALGGQKVLNFTASGHLDASQAGALNTMFGADTITFAIVIGDETASTDGGAYSGTCVVSNYTIDAAADGQWSWSLAAQSTGDVTYTPADSSSSSS